MPKTSRIAMDIRLSPKGITSLFPTEILFQTDYWAQVKSRLGCTPLAFDIHSTVLRGDVLVLMQPLGKEFLAAYVPQGPESAPMAEDHGPVLEVLSEALIRHLTPKVAFIRYDLPWESQYAEEMKTNHWSSFPEPRLRELRMNMGTKSWNLRKAEMDMTVASTLVLDIDDSEANILARMKPKTRYNVGLSKRKGVAVSETSMDQLPLFYELYRQTARRNSFPICDYRHFLALFQTHEQRRRDSELLFLLARHDRHLLAGAIVVMSGKTAYFLYGASSSEHRNLMGSHAVHWSAILHARARGCLRYDMGAVSPDMSPDHPFHGLYRFKTGFGGRVELRCGSWDYPLKEDVYNAFRNADALSRGAGH